MQNEGSMFCFVDDTNILNNDHTKPELTLRVGNEGTDIIAKKSINSPSSELISFSTLVDIKTNINKYCRDIWNTE